MINPYNMEITDWFDNTGQLLSDLILVPKLLKPEEWREWARAVIQWPTISERIPPSPDQFTDWREWASRFNLSMESIL